MLNNLFKYMAGVIMVTMVSSINASQSGIIDFGDANLSQLIQKLDTIEAKTRFEQVIITQFGDSHSAADFFTGEFRRLMQAKYGNAGLGWITPMSVQGQYHTAVKWQSKNWQLFNSRTENNMDFPMGGYVAKPTKANASILVTPNVVDDIWQVRLTLKTDKTSSKTIALYDRTNQNISFTTTALSNTWQQVSAVIESPFTIKGEPSIELGSIWLTRQSQAGVVMSTIATNGARQSIWQKWNSQWLDELVNTRSDLIMLAYGTNESFDTTLNLDEYQRNLITNIRAVRHSLPNAVILLISPPDTMMSGSMQSDECSARQPPLFSQIKQIQTQVAKEEKTLFWDWQQAMGGSCIIEKWQLMGLAKPDLVHQTQQGYIESAKIFYADLIEFIGKNRR